MAIFQRPALPTAHRGSPAQLAPERRPHASPPPELAGDVWKVKSSVAATRRRSAATRRDSGSIRANALARFHAACTALASSAIRWKGTVGVALARILLRVVLRRAAGKASLPVPAPR